MNVGWEPAFHLGVVHARDAKHRFQQTPPRSGHHRLLLHLPRHSHLHFTWICLENGLVQSTLPRLSLSFLRDGALQQHLHDGGHRRRTLHRSLSTFATAVVATLFCEGLHISGLDPRGLTQHSKVFRS